MLAADVFTTDPQLLTNKYVQLRDPKNMFGFQYVAPVVDRDLVRENGARFTATLNAVSRLLTVQGDAGDEQGRRRRQEVGREGRGRLPARQQAQVAPRPGRVGRASARSTRPRC